jgi:hypothetical protein
MTVARFNALLDTLGTDMRRWPEALRAPAEALLLRDGDARAAFRASGALDGLLASAPAMSHAREMSLADRISAAAVQSPRLAVASVAPDLRVAAMPVQLPRWPVYRQPKWQGAAVLAASLLMGIFVGQTETSRQAFVEMAGLSADQAAPDGGSFDQWDEE